MINKQMKDKKMIKKECLATWIDNMIYDFESCKTDEDARNTELYNLIVNQQGYDEDVLDKDVAIDAMGVSQALGIECQCPTCREVSA